MRSVVLVFLDQCCDIHGHNKNILQEGGGITNRHTVVNLPVGGRNWRALRSFHESVFDVTYRSDAAIPNKLCDSSVI